MESATTLAMARLAPTLTAAQLQQQTIAYFNAMFAHPEAKNLSVTPTYTTAGGSQLVDRILGGYLVHGDHGHVDPGG